MIGVLPRAGQAEAVEEFFELFKTPWEYYAEGRPYNVLVVTGDPAPDQHTLDRINAKAVLVYCASPTADDVRRRVRVSVQEPGRVVDVDGVAIPVFGESATFHLDAEGRSGVPAGTAVVRHRIEPNRLMMRIGYDLFDEVARLLSIGQPVQHAGVPTLDLHIRMLRDWILSAGLPLVEIPPAPAGHAFGVCLTHDIDFIGIRQHRFDHSMWGFLYRSTVGAVLNVLRGRLSPRRLLDCWRAAASLPFVYLGWARDFWEPFEWYLRVEEGLPATYFLIPFKGRAGERVPGAAASRRATAYDAGDLGEWPGVLEQAGCELGVHGIDSWHSPEKGRDELARVRTVSRSGRIGMRMHWLMCEPATPAVLEEAGYAYDSTAGYNETVGYRNGTSQVYRPLGVRTLLELPMHIQDGALFYPTKLNLTDDEAWRRCAGIFEHAKASGGVVTLLWHDRSHGPERFWGDFYTRLIESVRSSGAWVATAGDAVAWFDARRRIRFEHDAHADDVRVRHDDERATVPGFTVRVHRPAGESAARSVVDRSWDGRSVVSVGPLATCSLS